jgi:hypothetical protein
MDKKTTPKKLKPQTEGLEVGGSNNYYSIDNGSIAPFQKNVNIRSLTKNEIECKISIVKDSGVSLLLYKTARTDMIMLDEVFGRMNWQCEYREIKGNMYCGISIFDEKKNQWVTKWDCGVQSAFGDKEKGEASDAFKRAGFKWGIGLELYTTPFIWVPKDKCNIYKDGRGNLKCNDKFEVEKIKIENKVITGISIKNNSNSKRAYVWTSPEQKGG